MALAWNKHGMVLGYLATVAVIAIAVTVEILNVQAGGKLPSREYRNGDPTEGAVQWRHAPWTTEAIWRILIGPKDDQGNPVKRPLTAAEQQKMQSDIAAARANNRLLEVVSTAGLAQYLLVPMLGVLGLLNLQGNSRRHGLAMLLVAICAGTLMLYRAYFTSLGW